MRKYFKTRIKHIYSTENLTSEPIAKTYNNHQFLTQIQMIPYNFKQIQKITNQKEIFSKFMKKRGNSSIRKEQIYRKPFLEKAGRVTTHMRV